MAGAGPRAGTLGRLVCSARGGRWGFSPCARGRPSGGVEGCPTCPRAVDFRETQHPGSQQPQELHSVGKCPRSVALALLCQIPSR